MSLLKLPKAKTDIDLSNLKFDLRSDALERWDPSIKAALENNNTISIYDDIGASLSGEGVTAKRISAALRSIGERNVVVNINSPGGSFFEGLAIYNLLLAHPGKVTVNILGLAASVASVIAMAGDEINVGDGAFLMVHNVWSVVMGNRYDLQEAIASLEEFDKTMAGIYASRSGLEVSEVTSLMDAETWLDPKTAINKGFATGRLNSESVSYDAPSASLKKPMAVIEAAMAKSGYSRSQRRDVFKDLFSGGMPSAATSTMPSAGEEITASLQNLISSMKGN